MFRADSHESGQLYVLAFSFMATEPSAPPSRWNSEANAIWPYSSRVLEKLTDGMSDAHVKMMAHDNTAQLHGLTV